MTELRNSELDAARFRLRVLLIALVLGWFWLRGREMQDGANLERAA